LTEKNRRRKNMRIGDILGVVIGVILLAVSIIIIAQFQTQVTAMNLTSEAQTQVAQVFSTGYMALQLLLIGVFVGAAIAIVAIVISGLGGLGVRTPPS